MSKIQQLIVLDLSEIDKKLTELANTEIKSDNHKASLLIQIMVYEKIKQQSKPLEPIVSDAWDAARTVIPSEINEAAGMSIVPEPFKNNKQEYLKTFNL